MGADACSSVIGNSTVDRFGCYDSDGDGHSTKMTIGVIQTEQMDIQMIQQDGPPPSAEGCHLNSCYRWRRYSNLDNYRIFTIYPKQKWQQTI